MDRNDSHSQYAAATETAIASGVGSATPRSADDSTETQRPTVQQNLAGRLADIGDQLRSLLLHHPLLARGASEPSQNVGFAYGGPESRGLLVQALDLVNMARERAL